MAENRVIKPYHIAEITGLHPQTVDRILNGTTLRIDLDKVDLVCRALGLESAPIFVYEAHPHTSHDEMCTCGEKDPPGPHHSTDCELWDVD